MSGFSGINNFGSLTTQNGTKIDYKYLLEKYDADGNGEISKDEFNTAIKEEKLDKVELSKVNTNGDEVIDEKEMGIYEQKYKMQEAVNAMSAQITKDFSGNKSQYIAQVTLELTNYITEFANNYQGEVSGMAEAFSKELPTKYTQIKKNVLANEPSSFKSQVLDDIVNNLQVGGTTKAEGAETISDTALTKIAKALETEANKYIKANPKCTESELKAHLEAFLNQTDADKMKSAADTFKANAGAFGTYIDGDELTQLKEYAKDFLTEALNNGVTVKLGSRNIATTNAITTALKSYTDGATLKADMETAIAGLSTVSKKDTIIQENMTIDELSGSNYKIDSSKIDFNVIEGYTDVQGNGTIYERGKGKSGSFEKAKTKARELLNQDALKNQYIQQITTMLESKGMKFDDIKTEFENIWSQSIEDTLNTDGMVTGRGARGLSSKGKAYINIKNMVDKFDELFQANIKVTMNAKVQANKTGEMYLGDLDLSAINVEDEKGTLTNARDLYFSGKTVTTKKHGADYYVKLAEQMIDQLKTQMMTKAKAMCAKKGVTFDEGTFNKFFNNAKKLAVNSAVWGMTSSGKTTGVAAGGTLAAAGTAGVIGAATATTTGISLATASTILGTSSTVGTLAAASSAGLTIGSSTSILGITVASSTVPVVGAVAAGAVMLGTVLTKLFSGHHSKSNLNTKTLIDNFANQFKADYSNWVEAEANKAKNK